MGLTEDLQQSLDEISRRRVEQRAEEATREVDHDAARRRGIAEFAAAVEAALDGGDQLAGSTTGPPLDRTTAPSAAETEQALRDYNNTL